VKKPAGEQPPLRREAAQPTPDFSQGETRHTDKFISGLDQAPGTEKPQPNKCSQPVTQTDFWKRGSADFGFP
jgi:hypothetical protein